MRLNTCVRNGVAVGCIKFMLNPRAECGGLAYRLPVQQSRTSSSCAKMRAAGNKANGAHANDATIPRFQGRNQALN
jgi:hypothetical protein